MAMVVALALGLVVAAVDVSGDVTCPTPADVSRRFAELAAPSGADGEHHRAVLSTGANGVHVELQSAAGAPLAERDLAVTETCAEMAAAVAVVIAAWEADLDPHVDARVNLPAPAAPRPSPPVVIAVAPAPPAASPMRFDLGLALIASLSGGQVAPGARIGGWLAPGGWRLGLGVAVAGVTARTESVGARPEAARWSRVALAAGPQVRFDVGRTTVDARAQALAALLRVEGVGLTTTAADSSGQLGTGFGVQVGRTWGNAMPWIGADLLFWPGRDRLEITGLASTGELPRFELQLALGLSFGRSP